METFIVKYNFEYVFDVFKYFHFDDNRERCLKDFVCTMHNYEEAALKYPQYDIIARPVMCICCKCGVITQINSFHNFNPNHNKNCKYEKHIQSNS